jgi:hypothetical protein
VGNGLKEDSTEIWRKFVERNRNPKSYRERLTEGKRRHPDKAHENERTERSLLKDVQTEHQEYIREGSLKSVGYFYRAERGSQEEPLAERV